MHLEDLETVTGAVASLVSDSMNVGEHVCHLRREFDRFDLWAGIRSVLHHGCMVERPGHNDICGYAGGVFESGTVLLTDRPGFKHLPYTGRRVHSLSVRPATMRQAVVDFDDRMIGEWGLTVLEEAGILGAEILSCESPCRVVRLRLAEARDPDRLDDAAAVVWWERVSDEEGHVYLIEAASTALTNEGAPDGDRYPLTEDVDVSGDGITLALTGSQDQIRDGVAALEAAEVDVRLKQLRGYRAEETVIDSLTDRQQELLELALEMGYYDVPRDATAKEVAREVGLNDSTVSEHLRRAERNLVSSALGRSP